MKQQDIDIYEILKNVQIGTEFYSPMCDKAEFFELGNKNKFDAITLLSKSGTEFHFYWNGKCDENGEVMFFPSKENRDWEEFAESLKPAFELGKLYVFYEEDEDGELTVIGRLIRKNEDEDTLTFGNQLEKETDNFVTDQAFDLRISAHKELRGATPMEEDAFCKAEYNWNCEKEKKRRVEAELKEHKFKTFEKVLARKRDEEDWLPALYIRKSGSKDKVFCISLGLPLDVSHCIPYEGSEYLAFTSDPF